MLYSLVPSQALSRGRRVPGIDCLGMHAAGMTNLEAKCRGAYNMTQK